MILMRFTFSAVNNEIVGFILAQMMPISKCNERSYLFRSPPSEDDQVCYVLTLGTKGKFRRAGLGSELLRICVESCRKVSNCGAVSSFPYVALYDRPRS